MIYTGGIQHPLATNSHRLGYVSLILNTASINFLSLALPIATLQIYDRVLHSQNFGTARALVAGVLIAMVLETILRLIRAHTLSQRGAAFVHSTSCQAINAQIETRNYHSKKSSVAFNLTNLNAIKSLKDFESGYAMVVFIDLLFLPIFIGVMAYISKSLVLIPVTLLCIFSIVTALSGRRAKECLDKCASSDEKRYDFLIDSLSVSKIVKSFGLEDRLQRRFESLHDVSCRDSYALSRILTNSFVTSTVLGHIMTAATVAAGAYMAVHGQLSVGALIAVVLLSSRLMQPVQKGVLLWIRFQDFQAAKQKVSSIFEKIDLEPKVEQSSPPNLGNIDLETVSFRTHPDAPLLLDRINLKIRRGECVTLDGGPGCGKTTLLKLIVGSLLPSSGTVRVNGADPAQMSPNVLVHQVGYLASRPTIFRGTIRDNITRFSAISSAQALEVAEMLDLSDDFSRLPLGIDTVVGAENETAITPGLEQMISILRVLASKPRVLLFDDADSGLDTRNYNAVFSLLGKIKHRVSLIIVSRDYNLRQLADRSYYLNDGRLTKSDNVHFSRLASGSRI